jgi:predicted HTH domain antitoxin
MAVHLVIDVPDTLPDSLQETPEQFAQEARVALAAKLFEMKRIPSGVAARIAGMDRVSFLLTLHSLGVPALALTADELEQDVRNA